ncbi:hypothetical protein [Lonsdalea quercina]|uniref:hypothetical protein n=1 Tax=Lonsdalea quercina TaxID=71657 RepID=UPI0039754B5E
MQSTFCIFTISAAQWAPGRGRVKASLPLAGHWNSSPLAFSVVFGKAKKVKKVEKMQYLFLRPSLLIRLGSTS